MNSSLLDRIVDPLSECLNQSTAQKIVDLRADDILQARVDELADKTNNGTLSEDERAEYDSYLAVFHIVSILQARARMLLTQSAS